MNTSNVLEHRLQFRRWRRWKRRARILAPFAALPLLLVTLMLSVDMVEYRPEEPDQKPTDYSDDHEYLTDWSSYSALAYTATDPIAEFKADEDIPIVIDVNLNLQPLRARTLGTSTAPDAPRR